MFHFTPKSALIALAIIVSPVTCLGQGLLFNLPPDGQGVEYEGEISYVTVRADIAEGTETVKKAREISIKSVGTEDRDFEGTTQTCRWIEIKVVTGVTGAGGIDPGPVGSRIYKVLVPESKIIATAVDDDQIPNVTVPIIEGWRRSGEASVRRMTSEAISFYPTICQLANYSDPETIAAIESPELIANDLSVNAKHLKGRHIMERPESRSTNEADYWVSDEVPFGLARWEVTVTREQKESTATRDKFLEVVTTTSTMSVRKILPIAESELIIPAGQ